MLWYKSWLESRWRFLIGLALLLCSAATVVFTYPTVARLLPLLPVTDTGGEIGRRIRESADLVRTYRGYVWSQWFSKNMPGMWTLFAALLGSGGLLPRTPGAGVLFTLSMPVSRSRLMGIRAATGLCELAILAFLPSLMIPLFSPSVGESYGAGSALIHGACLFIAGSVFFSLAFLLSTMVADVWRPLLAVLVMAGTMSVLDQVSPVFGKYSVFRVMTGESYFRVGEIPWPGLFVSALIASALMYSAVVNFRQRDF